MLPSVMRGLLLASGPVNALGALLFAPPMAALRRSSGLPDADAFYLWTLSAWVFAFGIAYVHMGWTGRADRGVLALGAWGKLTFAILLTGLALEGRVPVSTAAGAAPDVVLAVAFVWWLWTSRASAGGTRP